MRSPEPAVARHMPSALSFLAPAALVLFPVLALAFATSEKNESYEWTQHRVTGLCFALAFATVLFGGIWRKGWPTAIIALIVLTTLVAATVSGLPGFHLLFALAGGMVAFGYWFASQRSSPPLLEVVAVGYCSVLCFWAVSRLSWWQPIDITLSLWSNKFIFLAVTALLICFLSRFTSGAEPAERCTKIARSIDLLMVIGLGVAVWRSNSLTANSFFLEHWSIYTVPVDLVREGRTLLGEVPSQYGFLSILVLAALPGEDSYNTLYWLNGALVWASAIILYFTLSTWLTAWWWKLSAALITASAVAFLCGFASELTGSIAYPSVGAMRFIWVYALLGFLLWHHLTGKKTSSHEPDWRAIWIGNALWLAGVLWAVESAAYVTAAWFPAVALWAMPAVAEDAGRFARFRALLIGIGRSLLRTTLLLSITVLIIGFAYRMVLGWMPKWSAYWEYAAAFSQGFGSLPIDPWSGVWALLVLHSALLAAIVSLDLNRHRSATALIWAAWGTLWSVSTYYVSRSHPNNITNLSPVLLMIVGLMVHGLRNISTQRLARPWLWLTVPSIVGAMLWLVLTNQSALKTQIKNYAATPDISRCLPPCPSELKTLIADCLMQEPGPYVVIGHSENDIVRIKPAPGLRTWLPVASIPLLLPLSLERRIAYLDIYRHDQPAGWFIAPLEQITPSAGWLFSYLNSRYVVRSSFKRKEWIAWYCVRRPEFIDPTETIKPKK